MSQSSIRIKTSKAPWAKKKQTQSNNTKKQNDSKQWPDLNTKTKPKSIDISNDNNTPSSTPKYKSNPIESNGHINSNASNTSIPNQNISSSNPSITPVKSKPIIDSTESNNNTPNNTVNSPKKRKRRKKKIKINNLETNEKDVSSQETSSDITPENTKVNNHNGHNNTHGHGYHNYNNYRGRGHNHRHRGRRHNRRGTHHGHGHGHRGGRYNSYRNNNNYYEEDGYYKNNRRNYRGNNNNNIATAPRHNRERYNNNNNNNNNNKERYDEHKSDTTTTTSNTTSTNSNNTTPTPVVNTMNMNINNMNMTYINPYMNIYNMNPYVVNPYINMGNISMIEPNIDTIHMCINQMQSFPQWTGEIPIPNGPYYVLKVSCVATGYSADDRSVGHIALIDWNLKTKANIFVKPDAEIISYISPLTSLNSDLLNKYGYTLAKAIEIIKSELPTNAVLIGQNITMDLQWLGLKPGTDFKTFIDLRDIWRTWSEYYKSYTHYSLNHQSKCILNIDISDYKTIKHSASFDGITTMKLFQYYAYCRYFNMSLFHNKIQLIKNTKITPSFSKIHPMYEGVQMQSKKYKGVPYITNKPKNITSPKSIGVKDIKTVTTTANDNTNNDKNTKEKKKIINVPNTLPVAAAQ